MAQQLTVKAYLKRWNAERKELESVDEIRRFSVDQDVATSYTYLMAKVNNVFPRLNNKSITLYWRGKFVTISFFLSSMQFSVLKSSLKDWLTLAFYLFLFFK